MGDLIEAYDEEHRPLPPVGGAEALRYLMRENGMDSSDLKEIGDTGLVSDLLEGRVEMNLGYARLLAARFSLPVTVFLMA